MEAAEEPAQPPAKPSATHAPVTPARYVDPPGGYLANTRTPSQQLEDELIASLTPRRSNGRGKRRAASQSSGPRKKPTPTRPTKDASTSVSPGFLCQFPNAQDSPEARDRQSTPDGAGSAARDDDGDLEETQLALAREMERSADLEQQLKDCHEHGAQLRAQLDERDVQLADAENDEQPDSSNDRIKRLEEELEACRGRGKKLNAEIDRLYGQNSALIDENKELRNTRTHDRDLPQEDGEPDESDRDSIIKQLQAEIDGLKNDAYDRNLQISDLTQENEILKLDKELSEDVEREPNAEVEDLTEENIRLSANVEKLQEELDRAQSQEDGELRKTIEKLQSENAKLKQANTLLSAARQTTRAQPRSAQNEGVEELRATIRRLEEEAEGLRQDLAVQISLASESGDMVPRRQLDRMHEQLEEQGRVVNQLENELERLRPLHELPEGVEALQKETAVLRSRQGGEMEGMISAVERVRDEAEDLRVERDVLLERMTNLEQSVLECEQNHSGSWSGADMGLGVRIADLQDDKIELASKLKECQEALRRRRDDAAEDTDALGELQANLNAEIQQLTEQLAESEGKRRSFEKQLDTWRNLAFEKGDIDLKHKIVELEHETASLRKALDNCHEHGNALQVRSDEAWAANASLLAEAERLRDAGGNARDGGYENDDDDIGEDGQEDRQQQRNEDHGSGHSTSDLYSLSSYGARQNEVNKDEERDEQAGEQGYWGGQDDEEDEQEHWNQEDDDGSYDVENQEPEDEDADENMDDDGEEEPEEDEEDEEVIETVEKPKTPPRAVNQRVTRARSEGADRKTPDYRVASISPSPKTKEKQRQRLERKQQLAEERKQKQEQKQKKQ